MNARKPAVAGQFYPADPGELRETVQQYLCTSQLGTRPDQVAAIVVPHAGLVFSGVTAGLAYSRVCCQEPKRVVLLGASHRYGIDRASVYDTGCFETCLGNFPIDEAFAKELAKETESTSIQPHMLEHCIEVQLPFLWGALGLVPIVPVLFGGSARTWHVEIGRRLAKMTDETDLVVASTELSRYLCEEEAHQIDKRTLDTILSQDCNAVIDGLAHGMCSMCGGAPVVAAMAYALARDATVWYLRDYRTSAKSSGDHSQVVGYAALTMEREFL